MAGYQPAGPPPADYLADPTVTKTWDEWEEIMYPKGVKKPFWLPLGKLAVYLGFCVKEDGKLVWDPSYYRRPR